MGCRSNGRHGQSLKRSAERSRRKSAPYRSAKGKLRRLFDKQKA